MELNIYKVIWKDITSDTRWQNAGHTMTPITVASIGFVVEKNKDYIMMISGIDIESGDAFGHTSIPWGCITELSELVGSKWIKRRKK